MEESPIPDVGLPSHDTIVAPVNPPASQPVDLRANRIDELVIKSLAQTDALQANLDSVMSDLLRLEYMLAQALLTSLGSQPALSDFEAVSPGIEMKLKMDRQIERFGHLKLAREKPSGDKKPIAGLPNWS